MSLANIMAEREILNEVEQKIQEYKILNTESARQELAIAMHLFIAKMDIQKRGFITAVNELNKSINIHNQLNNLGKS